MDKKYGVYICTGCGIGDALDMEDLVAVPDEEGINCTTHPFLCSKEGIELIQKDVDDGKVNTMVIGACSRRVNFDVFNFEGCIVERANLREGVVWPHSRETYPKLEEDQKDDEEHFDPVQMKAEDYIKMAMIRIEKVKLPEPFKTESFSKKILVLGGGITGMSAALDAAKAGYDVTIVEKTGQLGGYAAAMRKQMPVIEPFESLQDSIVPSLVSQVEAMPNIEVKTNTEVARIAGQPGEFTVTMKTPGEKIPFDVPFPLPEDMLVDENGKELDAEAQHAKYLEYNTGREDILTLDPNGELFGAVVLAAGWRPATVQGEAYAHLGIDLADVVTNDAFEKIAAKGKIVRPLRRERSQKCRFYPVSGQG